MAATKLALLDRDATLIDVVRDSETGIITTAFHPSHIRILGGVIPGLLALRDAGYTLAIVSNQPGPAKGHFPANAVAATNEALVAELARSGIHIARVDVCMHHPDGGPGGDPALVGPCACRKPKPGMLLASMAALGAVAESTWMIGDSSADIQAARAAGTRAALLFDHNRCELCPLRNGPKTTPDVSAAKLDKLARLILEREGQSPGA